MNNANICRYLDQAAIKSPNDLAIAIQQKRRGQLIYQECDFATLARLSDQMAHALTQYGLTSGMKAVLMISPGINFFALTTALFKAGIVPILVDPGMGIKNLKQCFIESQPDIFIGIGKAHLARRLFNWGRKSLKYWISVDGFNSPLSLVMPLQRLLTRYPLTGSFTPFVANSTEMAAILFTSGSTGSPKGVVYNHRMFEAQINALKDDYGIQPGERDLATFPLFALFGPALGMASIIPLMNASKPITANPQYVFSAIERYQCTNMFANPALIDLLGTAGAKRPSPGLPSLKRVISAGAPATISAVKLFSQHLLAPDIEILTSYGATESLPLTMIGSKQLITTAKLTDNGGGICVGRPINGVNINVISISDQPINQWHDNLLVATGTIGEIVVSGPMVSQAYYQRPPATAQAKIDVGTLLIHRMGDLGYLDHDGNLWMCGRKAHRVEVEPTADLPSCYYSIPCERIFNTHPQVKRTALVGIIKDQRQQPLLCIELNYNATITSQQLFSELTDIAKQHSQCNGITDFLLHKKFPVDIRHNAKIFREKLASWAQNKY